MTLRALDLALFTSRPEMLGNDIRRWSRAGVEHGGSVMYRRASSAKTFRMTGDVENRDLGVVTYQLGQGLNGQGKNKGRQGITLSCTPRD